MGLVRRPSGVHQFRRATAEIWTAENPLLVEGELGLETDTLKIKFGDGLHQWNDLDYATPEAGGGGGLDGVTAEDGELVAAKLTVSPDSGESNILIVDGDQTWKLYNNGNFGLYNDTHALGPFQVDVEAPDQALRLGAAGSSNTMSQALEVTGDLSCDGDLSCGNVHIDGKIGDVTADDLTTLHTIANSVTPFGQTILAAADRPAALDTLGVQATGAANPLYLTESEVEPVSKLFVTGAEAVDSGNLVLAHFVAGVDTTVSHILTAVASDSTQSAATLCKVGLYEWDGTTYTLLEASDTAADRWDNPAGTTSITNTATITSTNLTLGQEYAVGLLHVGSTGAPKLLTASITNLSEVHGPRICQILGGATDLDASITGTATFTSWFFPWTVLQ